MILKEGGVKAKGIEVKHAASISLQMHRHCSEHWVVVSDVAKVLNGNDGLSLTLISKLISLLNTSIVRRELVTTY